jgi:hypothetical protein
VKVKYKVWDPDSAEEADADEVESFEPAYAAEQWVEDNWTDLEYPDEIDVCVKDPDGKVTNWTVTVEQRPHFSAAEKKGEANAS